MATCLILLSSTVTIDHIPHVVWKHNLLLYDVQCPVSYTRLNLPLGYQWNVLQIVEKVSATSGPIAAKELSIFIIYRGYVRVAVCQMIRLFSTINMRRVWWYQRSNQNTQTEVHTIQWQIKKDNSTNDYIKLCSYLKNLLWLSDIEKQWKRCLFTDFCVYV